MTIEVMQNLEGLVRRLQRQRERQRDGRAWLATIHELDIALLESAIKALKKEGYQ
jgi:hypothetical protein